MTNQSIFRGILSCLSTTGAKGGKRTDHHFNFPVRPSVCLSVFQVADNSEINKMTNSNLAVVFGPNLLWGRDNAMSLSAIGPINNFTRTLLDQQHLVFE